MPNVERARAEGAQATTASDPQGGVGPSILSALEEQPGLKLKKVKDVAVDVLVVDHADKVPTEN